MIRSRLFPVILAVLAAAALTGCDDWMPGKPKREDAWKSDTEITDGAEIYRENCLGCHSIGTTTGPSLALNNPIYLAMIPPETLRAVIANGVPGSQMPAFLIANGGGLTEKQVDILVAYILEHKKPIEGPLPPYSAPLGNAAAGETAFAAYLASFPGMSGPGSVLSPAFLGLLSDQYLRSLVIAGRPELGLPDYRSRVAGKIMSDQEIADTVAWLASNRKNEFGQPLTTPTPFDHPDPVTFPQ